MQKDKMISLRGNICTASFLRTIEQIIGLTSGVDWLSKNGMAADARRIRRRDGEIDPGNDVRSQSDTLAYLTRTVATCQIHLDHVRVIELATTTAE